MLNPWIILAGVLSLVAASFAGYHRGHASGMEAQQAIDQREFDRINAERARQTAEANALYRKAQDDAVALATARDQLKTQLEVEHAQHQKATDDLRASLAARRLRFALAESPGPGRDRAGAAGAGDHSAGAARAAVVQLPDALTANLRRLAFDADRLADDYRQCYGYAQRVR